MQPIFPRLADDNLISDDFSDRPEGLDHKRRCVTCRNTLIVMTDGQITDQFRPKTTGFVDPDTNTQDNEKVQYENDPDKVDGTDYDLFNATVETGKQPANNRFW